MFGDGEQTRDYVFVKDVARANLLAASASVSRGDRLDVPAFNIATGHETSVNDLPSMSVGRSDARPRSNMHRPAPVNSSLLPRCLEGGARTEVAPEVSFDEGMKQLAAWFEGTVT